MKHLRTHAENLALLAELILPGEGRPGEDFRCRHCGTYHQHSHLVEMERFDQDEWEYGHFCSDCVVQSKKAGWRLT